MLYLLLSALCAGFLTDLYAFAIGDPHLHGDPKPGRILSALGRWLSDRYAYFQDETERERSDRIEAAQFQLGGTMTSKPHEDAQEWLYMAQHYDRVNPWKATGLCPRCTSMWVSLLVLVGHVAAAGLSPWWLCSWLLYAGVAHVGLSLSSLLRSRE